VCVCVCVCVCFCVFLGVSLPRKCKASSARIFFFGVHFSTRGSAGFRGERPHILARTTFVGHAQHA